ncbi:hypothetical protein MUP38_03145 [Candidatus Bathyarchaeota archaeon]|nr:hypothetical protein [Candidatus Bathyarchaeota archaeon]
MKKMILVILAVIAVCSLCFAGIVGAAKEGYGFSISTGSTPTFDGAVGADEWYTDSYKDWLYNGWTKSTSFFMDKWLGAPTEGWLIEVLTDTTNDAGDYFQFSVDTLVDGGAAPQVDDFLINVTGHPGTVAVFAGTGTGWGASSAVVTTDYVVATSVAASTALATPHWIIEIFLNKQGAFAMAMSNNMRMAAYDASTGQTVMWPPYSNANAPDTYGTGTTDFTMTPYPEGLTLGVMLTVSTIAAIASARYFRKPKL